MQTSKLHHVIKQLLPPVVLTIRRALKLPPPLISKFVFDQHLQFSVDWFSPNQDSMLKILCDLEPSSVIEIGSLEGMTTCYFIEQIATKRPLEIHAIDTWEGGVEHQPAGHATVNMSAVERTFLQNVERCVAAAPEPVNLRVHKCLSYQALSRLIAEGREQRFDLIYVDGSHQAPDVLSDAILSFKLLRVGGIIVFDDYLWEEPIVGGTDPLRCPKPAIDAFVNIYIRKLNILNAPLRQMYVRKISE